MNAPANWEDILKATRYDLSQDRWDAIESRLRERIREDRSEAALAPPSFADRLRDAIDVLSAWLVPAPARWIGAGALGVLVLGIGFAAWNRQTTAPTSVASNELHWQPGQTLQSEGRSEWIWPEGRTRIALRGGAMHLERDADHDIRIQVASGTASFQVEHRTAEESFHVGFGACRIEVVGTSFTIRVDSTGSSASVQEGRVRFLGLGRDRYLDAGQELSCTPLGAPSAATATESVPTAAPSRPAAATPAARTVAAPSAADSAFGTLEALCRAGGTACTEARADFVRRFPSDPRSAELGWAWGEAAKAAGDFRDALFAWDVAARSERRIGMRAAIAAVELRLGELPDAARAAQDLDRVLPRLETGSSLWVRAWSLRREAARLLGETSVQRRADSVLATPRSASGGP